MGKYTKKQLVQLAYEVALDIEWKDLVQIAADNILETYLEDEQEATEDFEFGEHDWILTDPKFKEEV